MIFEMNTTAGSTGGGSGLTSETCTVTISYSGYAINCTNFAIYACTAIGDDGSLTTSRLDGLTTTRDSYGNLQPVAVTSLSKTITCLVGTPIMMYIGITSVGFNSYTTNGLTLVSSVSNLSTSSPEYSGLIFKAPAAGNYTLTLTA